MYNIYLLIKGPLGVCVRKSLSSTPCLCKNPKHATDSRYLIIIIIINNNNNNIMHGTYT